MNLFILGLLVGAAVAIILITIDRLLEMDRRERIETRMGIVLGALSGVALIEALRLTSERRKKIKRKK